MVTNGEQNIPNAPVSEGETTPASPPISDAPKFEVIDGVVTVDGKKFVRESDLIAAKGSLQGRLDEAQTVHKDAVDKLSLQVSESNQEVAKANAALKEATDARSTGDVSAEETSRIKQEAETAKTDLTTANTSLLDMKRKLIMASYNIPADSEAGQSLLQKDSTQLDSFEEALKALSTNPRGPGNYALGGFTSSATPMTEMERASKVLDATPVRGVRNPAG